MAGKGVSGVMVFVAALPEILIGSLIVGIIIVLIGAAKKFGLIGQTEADKLQEEQNKTDRQGTLDLAKQKSMKISALQDFLKAGLGASELHNQYPYSAAEVADMVIKIYKEKPLVGYASAPKTIAIINTLPSKLAVSSLALSFQTAYSVDMLQFFKDNFKDDSNNVILGSIKDKPDFKDFLPASKEYLKKNNITLIL